MENWRKLLKETAEEADGQVVEASGRKNPAYDPYSRGLPISDEDRLRVDRENAEQERIDKGWKDSDSEMPAEPNDTDGDGFTDAKLDEKSFDVLSKLAKALSGQRVPFEAEDGEIFLATMEALGINREALLK